ncbi:Rare lipoprotein A [Candidatus Sulfopaludibacter sp. SbA3]|nr:Rare lipoprotein A [Candidatus Sulfopaludibacter sp. SbA3]
MKAIVPLALILLALSGCHKKHARGVPPPPLPVSAAVAVAEPGYTETGVASWYGHPYHGRPAADGETYDMETLVAAHRTLPFNTWVRVVNLTNSKSVDVRIIDRGPFIDGRIIDLSHAAAQAIGMEVSGTATVRMEVIRAPETIPAALFAVQVGAFGVRANAERTRTEMASRFGSARLVERPENPGVWRVMVGSETTLEAANALLSRISQETETKAFVVRLN